MKKEMGYVIICPFQDYPTQKKKWVEEHPTAVIKEEFRNISVQVVDVPNLNIVKKIAMQPEQVLMVMWAALVEEDVPLTESNRVAKLISLDAPKQNNIIP